MPRYQFQNPFPQIFGDLHHGVNASVEGLEAQAYELNGTAVELHDGQFVVTDAPVVHAFLHEVDGAGAPVIPEVDPVAPEVAPVVPEVAPPTEIAPETAPENTPEIAPEGAEQNTEVQQ